MVLTIVGVGLIALLACCESISISQKLNGKTFFQTTTNNKTTNSKTHQHLTIRSPNNHTCKIHTFGACITSYKSPSNHEHLGKRQDNDFSSLGEVGSQIKAGIPHCFAQFGPGVLKHHGFARYVSWEVFSLRDDEIVLRLMPTLEVRNITNGLWEYDF